MSRTLMGRLCDQVIIRSLMIKNYRIIPMLGLEELKTLKIWERKRSLFIRTTLSKERAVSGREHLSPPDQKKRVCLKEGRLTYSVLTLTGPSFVMRVPNRSTAEVFLKKRATTIPIESS